MKRELRQDTITGEWSIISPNRRLRPHEFKATVKRSRKSNTRDPFKDPQKSGNEQPLLIFKNKTDWRLQVIPNKYPALTPGTEFLSPQSSGPYLTLPAVGYHELIITKSHKKNFSDLSLAEATEVLLAAQTRYQAMARDKNMAYALFFQNWGPAAGASVIHPHYQLIGLPVIPPEVFNYLAGSLNYYKKHKTYPYRDVILVEKKHKRRIINENKGAIGFTRFTSQEPFDFRVFPQDTEPYFIKASQSSLEAVADCLRASLRLLKKNVGDPDYNFYLHSAPLLESSKYKYYQWHIDVVPRLSVSAGLELGIGVEVTTLDPDLAAKILKQNA